MFRAILFFLALLSPAWADARTNAIQPELIVNSRAVPGGATDLAILMHTRPGWHGYWLNPGDAGLPMSVEWHLPPGWSVGPLRYPVPSKLLVAGIVNYVYEKDYAVLARLQAPAGATGSQRIAATMRWLACTDEICVPEQGEVSLDVPTSGMAPSDSRFDQWRESLPRPLSAPSHVERNGNTVRIGIPLPASVMVAEPYFFPATDGAIAYDAPQRFFRDRDMLIAELTAGPKPSEWIDGVIAYGSGQGLAIVAMPGDVPEGGKAIGNETGLLAALAGALIGGLLLNLMPCVFPILAVKAMHLARAGGDEKAVRREAIAYAGGAVVGTAALGGVLLLLKASGSAAGWAFQLQDPRTTLLLILLAIAITLNFLKLFELPVLAGERAPAGSFGTGALAAFVATPCSGPFLGVALGAALLLPLWGSVAVFAALGLGLALPFMAIAFIPPLRQRLPKPGPWMERLQRFLALPMAATAAACLWLLYRQAGTNALWIGLGLGLLLALVLVATGRIQRGGSRAWPLAAAGTALLAVAGMVLLPAPGTGRTYAVAGRTPWSIDAVARARAGGHPVFVYFTADWCLTCKANEAAAIDREATQAAFKRAGVVTLAGDWTNGDPAIGRFLESRGRAGVPLYLWYEPGNAEPEELPQVLTPSMLTDRAQRDRR